MHLFPARLRSCMRLPSVALGIEGCSPLVLIAADMETYAKRPCERQAGVVNVNETWAVTLLFRKQPRRPYGLSRTEHQHRHMIFTCFAKGLPPEQTTVPKHWAAP